MPTFYGNQQSQFYHIARNPELVFVKDRDVVAFWPDMLPFDANGGMAIYRDSGKTNVQYQTSGTQSVARTERTLVWGRMSGDEIVGGLRWVPYIISSDVDTVSIAPLREVIAPRVVYDKSSNTLSLWFWTNVKNDYDGVIYDETQLEPVLATDFGLQVPLESPPPASGGKNAKRVLCYAIGTFYSGYVEGGALDGFQSTESAIATDSFDMVPVFSTPRILNWTQTPDTAAGAVVDGWYGSGIQGFQGFQGSGASLPTGLSGVQVRVVHGVQFNGNALQVRYKDVKVIEELNTTDWIDVFLTATCPTGATP